MNLRLLTSLILLLACLLTGCSEQNNNGKTPALEPTDLEKNTKFYKLLNAPSGVSNLQFNENRTLISLVCSASAPIRGRDSMHGMQASQQAAIWIACAELVSWMRTNVNSAAGSTESDSALSGVQVLYLKTDILKQEVKAILSFKPQSQNFEIGNLPKMTISQTTKFSEEVVSGSKKNKPSKAEFYREIKVDGVLVISETINTSTEENGAQNEIMDYKQFFANGKPNLEETRTTVSKPGNPDSIKADGIIWDAVGTKSRFSH